MEMTRCMLHEKNLPKRFWGEAANTVVYLQNRISTKAVKDLTPFEACMLEESKDERLEESEDERQKESEDEQQDALVDDAPIRGTRLLSDIYQRCNVVVCESAGFHDAKKQSTLDGCNARGAFDDREKLNLGVG